MKKRLTLLLVSLLAFGCVDETYDLSTLKSDALAIGDDNSVFTAPLLTLSVSIGEISNGDVDLVEMCREADAWLPDVLPGGAEAVDVETLMGERGTEAQTAYLTGPDGLLTALMDEIDADPQGGKLVEIAEMIHGSERYRKAFDDLAPGLFPSDAQLEEYVGVFQSLYGEPGTRELIRSGIESCARQFLTLDLNMTVEAFVLDGIDVGSDVRKMITGNGDGKVSISLFGDIVTDLPLEFSAEPSFERGAGPAASSGETLFRFPVFTVSAENELPTAIAETEISSEALNTLFEEQTSINLQARLKRYFPRQEVTSRQGIVAHLKVRRKGALIFNN